MEIIKSAAPGTVARYASDQPGYPPSDISKEELPGTCDSWKKAPRCFILFRSRSGFSDQASDGFFAESGATLRGRQTLHHTRNRFGPLRSKPQASRQISFSARAVPSSARARSQAVFIFSSARKSSTSVTVDAHHPPRPQQPGRPLPIQARAQLAAFFSPHGVSLGASSNSFGVLQSAYEAPDPATNFGRRALPPLPCFKAWPGSSRRSSHDWAL